MNLDILNSVVENIFRKAQLEKEYCVFYGKICEQMIKLELALCDKKHLSSTIKTSEFRKKIFTVCKSSFEKFFDEEEKQKSKETIEKANKFKDKLFGNLDFIGELYRRQILPESILVQVQESLLGILNMDTDPDDFTVEGAINLMNKVGQEFENRNRNPTRERDVERRKNFDNIFGKFAKFRDIKDETVISNRIKILIKNLFSNKNSGW